MTRRVVLRQVLLEIHGVAGKCFIILCTSVTAALAEMNYSDRRWEEESWGGGGREGGMEEWSRWTQLPLRPRWLNLLGLLVIKDFKRSFCWLSSPSAADCLLFCRYVVSALVKTQEEEINLNESYWWFKINTVKYRVNCGFIFACIIMKNWDWDYGAIWMSSVWIFFSETDLVWDRINISLRSCMFISPYVERGSSQSGRAASPSRPQNSLSGRRSSSCWRSSSLVSVARCLLDCVPIPTAPAGQMTWKCVAHGC